jgi:hypothetical protein
MAISFGAVARIHGVTQMTMRLSSLSGFWSAARSFRHPKFTPQPGEFVVHSRRRTDENLRGGSMQLGERKINFALATIALLALFLALASLAAESPATGSARVPDVSSTPTR